MIKKKKNPVGTPDPDDRPVFRGVSNFSLKNEQPGAPVQLNVVPYKTSAGPSMHTHDFYELIYIQQGSGVHKTARGKEAVFTGDCLLVGPWEAHGFIEADNLLVVNVIYYPELYAEHNERLMEMPGFLEFFSHEPLFLAGSAARRKVHLDVAQQNRFLAVTEAIRLELAERGDGYDVACRGLFLELVVQVSRCAGRILRNTAQAGTEEGGMRREVGQAIAYLEQHYHEEVRLGDVARAVFLSESRFCHVFSAATGMSLFDYLNRIRIDKACQMLRTTNKDIGMVCEAVGVRSPAYFARVFRKVTGVSPTEYRKKRR